MSNTVKINGIERFPTALNFTVSYAQADDGASTVELSMQIPFTNTLTTGPGAGGLQLYYPVEVSFTGITGKTEDIFLGRITSIQLVHSNDGIIWDVTAKTDLHMDEESALDRHDFTNLVLQSDTNDFKADAWDAVSKILKSGPSPNISKYKNGAVYPLISKYAFDLGTTRLEAAQEVANLTGFLLWDDGLGWRFETPNNQEAPSSTFYVKWQDEIPPNVTNASFSVDSSGNLFNAYYVYTESGAPTAKLNEAKFSTVDEETGAAGVGQLWKFGLTNQILTTVQDIAAPLTSSYASATGPENEPAIDRETNGKNFNFEDDPLRAKENYTDCMKEESPLLPSSSADSNTITFDIHPPPSYDPKNSTLIGFEIKRKGGKKVPNISVGASDVYTYVDSRHIDTESTTYVYNARATIAVNEGEIVTTQWSHDLTVVKESGGGPVLTPSQLSGLGDIQSLFVQTQPGQPIYKIPEEKFTYEQIEFPWGGGGESLEVVKLFALWNIAKKIADAFHISLSYPAWTGPKAGDLVNVHWAPELELLAPGFFSQPLRVKSVSYALDANMGYTAEYELIPSILFDIITPYEARAAVATPHTILTIGDE